MLRWFNAYNIGKAYQDQVKPFNFLLSFHATREAKNLRPISAYDKNIKRASKKCFDRKTAQRTPAHLLKSCRDFLAQYHLHPEAKFENGDYRDSGFTQRRHIIVDGIEHIGKEANHLEEQFYLGRDDDAQVVYGMSKDDFQKFSAKIFRDAKKFNRLQLAAAANYSVRELSRFVSGRVKPSRETVFRIQKAMETFKAEDQEKEGILSKAKTISEQIGLRAFAKLAGINAGNLSYHLNGKRTPSPLSFGKLQIAVSKFDQDKIQ